MERTRAGAGRAPIVILLLASACGPGEPTCGEDASSSDAGACVMPTTDAEVPAVDAGPPPLSAIVVDAPCEPVEEVMHDEEGTGSPVVEVRWTHWYAELRDERIGPSTIRSVSALGCDVERFGELPSAQCTPCSAAVCGADDERTCTGTPPPAALACSTLDAEMGDGIVRVTCGSRRSVREETAPGAGTFGDWTDDDSQRVRTVRIAALLDD